jgi:hypothetical protein
VSKFSSPGFVDDACGSFDVFAYVSDVDASCLGNGGGAGVVFGGEFGYRYPIRQGLDLVIQTGVDFGSRHQMEIELEGVEPGTGNDFWVNAGYHFRTTNIYGGVGVRFDKIMIGGTFGRVLHSGHNFFDGELSYFGFVLDSFEAEEDHSGSGAMFGLRFQFDLRPGLGVRADYRFFGFDTGNSGDDFESGYQITQTNHRTLNLGVVVDLPRLFRR